MKPAKKRKPGRPKGVRYSIQKLFLFDTETAEKLATLAAAADLTESAYLRQLILAQ